MKSISSQEHSTKVCVLSFLAFFNWIERRTFRFHSEFYASLPNGLWSVKKSALAHPRAYHYLPWIASPDNHGLIYMLNDSVHVLYLQLQQQCKAFDMKLGRFYFFRWWSPQTGEIEEESQEAVAAYPGLNEFKFALMSQPSPHSSLVVAVAPSERH